MNTGFRLSGAFCVAARLPFVLQPVAGSIRRRRRCRDICSIPSMLTGNSKMARFGKPPFAPLQGASFPNRAVRS